MKTFLQRLIDENKRRFETRTAEIVRMMSEIEAAEPIIRQLETQLGNQLKVCSQLEDNTFYPRPLFLSETYYSHHDRRLHDCLLSLGFVEVYRLGISSGLYDHAIFEKGQVFISIDTAPGYRTPDRPAPANQKRRVSDKVAA
ncbi:hypothetical protein ACO0LM_10415 [Undibacterium sp. Di26W]|uniref:hypothetical protein n=1 Tax=Undibacterium sp. Di26W TaxID=3413035 RepID=UPI003BF32910